jgi:radical SAM-linked protein
MRFTSVRDFQRALERAVRRSGVPVAFTAGFHPHPRISYANAAPTGAASEAEYAEIALSNRCDPQAVRDLLDAALPDGLDIVAVVEPPPGALADLLEASLWSVRCDGADPAVLRAAVDALLAAERIEVTRMMKTGPRTIDVRAALVSAAVDASGEPGCAILRVVVRHATPAVRPDDVLNAMRTVAGFEPPTPPLATRLAQGPFDSATATVANPLAPAENSVGA